MEGEKRAKHGSFNQDPHMILYGMPDFSIQDKWALLALIGMCWDRRQLGMTLKELEGPYKLSLREIAAITGVKHNALRSTGGKDPRIGVLDRWQEIGYLTVIEARPIDEVTGKPGRMQTYLYIHLERIWTDNAAFTESWHRPPGRLVSEDSFERVVDADTVHHVNTLETPLIVHVVNSSVPLVNNEVHTVNSIGHHVNVTVHDASSKSDTIQSKKEKKKERKKEDVSFIHSFTLSSDSLDKIKQVCQDCEDDNIDQHLLEAERLYRLSKKSEDIFYDFLFHAEAYINRYGPKTMQEFFDGLREFLKINSTREERR